MDKLGAALERLERDQEQPQSLRAIPGAKAAGKQSGAVEPITYTRTRVVSLSPEILGERRIALGANDELANAFKLLRTQLLMRMRENGWNTLAVTSPGPNAGKTSVAINLAISLALEMDQTVLLVDADLRRPHVAALMGFQPGPGLSDYLVDQTPVEDLFVHPGVGRLVVLPGNQALPNSAELLRSPMMAALVRELKNRYANRVIVFDLPSVLESADALAFSPLVDAAVIVVEDNGTSREDVERACELLHATNLLGVVLNKSQETRPRKKKKAGLLGKWLARFREQNDV